MLSYEVVPWDERAHVWQVSLVFEHDGTQPLRLSLPNWVPGSYMIRDFARHVVAMAAECDGSAMPIRQISKNSWQLPTQAGRWCVRYRVYAFDVSVRGSFLSPERGFFDGAALLVWLHGRQDECCLLNIRLPERLLQQDWSVATAMPLAECGGSEPGLWCFQAASYAALIDHPVECGRLQRLAFEAEGVAHEIVLSGDYPVFDEVRLQQDVAAVCAAQLRLFAAAAPFERYVFLLHVADEVYGGLEHRASTALLANRLSLPAVGAVSRSDDYVALLGLFSHEYFHAWNVKAIKPQAFEDYDLQQEVYTEQLWAFEGMTSYYDDLMLVRAGVITPERYLTLLAKNLTRVQQGAGRLHQSLAQSSFNAWTKYYKQDENSPNAIVSYYQKGALLALCLDLLIRRRSNGAQSLDDVMRGFYQDYLATGKGLPEGAWQARAQAIVGCDVQAFIQAATEGCTDLPVGECLADAGVALRWLAAPRSEGGQCMQDWPDERVATDFGARRKTQPDGIVLTHVLAGGSAERAGLAARDRIVAINGHAWADFDAHWARAQVGDEVVLHLFRHGVLKQVLMTVQAAAADTAYLRIEAPQRLAEWLQPPTTALA